ncbi:hypothetical protein [Polaribacter aquimarinus]|jgi:hypothetical protein|uniref:Uncharacterized protein n=1 Tax=Polaribacter aquimarinus TaxID=2100726 RepID=A0A2U2J6S7_9FLAO|nr:hypothetical protein [Polaribacter aquimarinus]PWG04036.1 hypothetical protein DIS07_14890 [Polaribacter aquimarinus]
MGIVILPFLLGALIIGIIALVKVIKLLKLKLIKVKDLGIGLIISILLFGLISLVYIIEGKAWGLSPAFRIPIFMVFIPFGIHIVWEKSKNRKAEYFSKIFLISIVFSVILGIIFNEILFDLIDYLGIKKHY